MENAYHFGKAGVRTDDAFDTSAFAGELLAAMYRYILASDEDKPLYKHRYYAEVCAGAVRADAGLCDSGADVDEVARRILSTGNVVELALLLRSYGLQRYLDWAIENGMRFMTALSEGGYV